MKNYTANEMQEMQRQAVERVREMQKRSQLPRKNADESDPEREVRGERQNRQTGGEARETARGESGKKAPDTPKHIQMPVNLSSLRPKEGEKGEFSLQMDADKALILALILLLSNEGADTGLILALLYIMY